MSDRKLAHWTIWFASFLVITQEASIALQMAARDQAINQFRDAAPRTFSFGRLPLFQADDAAALLV